ncbi:MAG: hypothetical protein R3C26_00615 [Calditrichia bacterium]
MYRFFGGQQRKSTMLPNQNRLVLVMVNEAARCLEEGILFSPRDVMSARFSTGDSRRFWVVRFAISIASRRNMRSKRWNH